MFSNCTTDRPRQITETFEKEDFNELPTSIDPKELLTKLLNHAPTETVRTVVCCVVFG